MFPLPSDNPTIARFIHKYKGHILHLWREEFFRWLFHSLPGLFEMIREWGFYRLLFAKLKLKSFCTIHAGLYLTHTYGLKAGARSSPSTGALINARGSIKIVLPIILIGASMLLTAVYYFYQQTSAQTIIPIHSSAQSIKDFPWDLELLSRPPKVKWLDKTGKFKSFFYEGLPYKDQKTEVFAYYATPGSISGDQSKDKNLPGIVIVHGGCQAASKSVVNLWVKRGYAAISMDLDGHGPDLVRLKNGGPPAEAYLSYDWNYHAVAKIILAHSLLLSFEEVDKKKTAIAGLSVGGHLTCIVAGIDDRFKAAASVYGSGFIYEKGFFKQWYQERLTKEEQRLWRDLIDPSNYLGHITCPVLFAGNPNDRYYPLEIRIKSYEILKNPFYLYINPDLPHDNRGHFLYLLDSFFDQYLNAGPFLPVLQKPERKGDKLYVRSSDLRMNHPAYLYFTTDIESSENRKWQMLAAQVDQNGIVADLPPKNATACFVNYLVDDGVGISSEVLIMNNSFYNGSFYNDPHYNDPQLLNKSRAITSGFPPARE